MPAELIAVTGPQSGVLRRLEGELFTIGRDAGNSLFLDDLTVSRRHCVLREEETGWRLEDLDTRNGTFVNGMPVRDSPLRHRDEIRVGATLLLFMEPGEEERPAAPSLLEAPGQTTRSMVVGPDPPIYFDGKRLSGGGEGGERKSRALSVLLSLCAELPGANDVGSLGKRLERSIREALPVRRGALLLADANDGGFGTVVEWAGEAAAGATLPGVDLMRAMDECSALRVELRGNQEALLAAPLLAGSEALGVVAAAGSTADLNDDHLEWLMAVAVIAGPVLEKLLRLARLQEENERLREALPGGGPIVGESPGLKAALRLIAKAGPADTTVLVQGETGTGKELVARAIHACSRRRGEPFVAVNCATLSETLLESDLFGHEKGAFTGAVALKRGKIEIAERGTLFLDEVGEMAPAVQGRLLRVLQEREFERVGGLRPLKTDVRVIAATNRDLERMTRDGTFRRDLYYRLNVINIPVPPLRERREDIGLLANYFLARYSEKVGRRILGFTSAARRGLALHDWPGNVRELENAIERAAVLGSGELIGIEDLPEGVIERHSGDPETPTYHARVQDAKRRLILCALEEAGNNHQEAARRLGLNPTYLSRLIRSLNLRSISLGTS